ncbi:hypothetical protein HPB48_018037 [Haemaphysalis longicornis]|uniref:Uncharacterized protein n=1 Tax=Haemaphysalis longicornis TaxID=44386 RepID=A0A9J6FJ76_HAELO|nr:hypothetical protein HPB48_018037 [Haemaphysalis longicornis]
MAVELPRPPTKAGSTTASTSNTPRKSRTGSYYKKRSPQRQTFPDTECKWARQVEEAYARWSEKD